jgi:hypothetical protein
MLSMPLVNLSYKKAYKSRLEDRIGKQLEASGVEFGYETVRLSYEVPAKTCRYTPDFCFKNIVIESKGWFRSATERQKMVLVRDQNPHLDIRFVFQNANKPIYKRSPTSYAKWASDNGFKWADYGKVPEEWLEELKDEV